MVQYLDSNLRVVKPGAFVRCAVTGQPIPLDELKYWSVALQSLCLARGRNDAHQRADAVAR